MLILLFSYANRKINKLNATSWTSHCLWFPNSWVFPYSTAKESTVHCGLLNRAKPCLSGWCSNSIPFHLNLRDAHVAGALHGESHDGYCKRVNGYQRKFFELLHARRSRLKSGSKRWAGGWASGRSIDRSNSSNSVAARIRRVEVASTSSLRRKNRALAVAIASCCVCGVCERGLPCCCCCCLAISQSLSSLFFSFLLSSSLCFLLYLPFNCYFTVPS